jgi:SPP1 family predicted phage head-tail adaptor
MGCKRKINPALCIGIGELRHYVEIEQVTETSDGAGGYTSNWTTFAHAWVSINPVSGREKFQAMQTETIFTHKIKMKWIAGITTKHRIKFGTRVFDIIDVRNIEERNIVLELMALEGMDG